MTVFSCRSNFYKNWKPFQRHTALTLMSCNNSWVWCPAFQVEAGGWKSHRRSWWKLADQSHQNHNVKLKVGQNKCSKAAFAVLLLKTVQACPSIILKTRGISMAILVKCDAPFILCDLTHRDSFWKCVGGWQQMQVSECVPSHTVSYIMLPLRLLQVLVVSTQHMLQCMICDLLRYFWRLQSWVSSILLIIENLALVTMEQLQPCLITMNFMHIHITHHSPNAWTNATQIHPPYLLLERALPCGALVTPSEAWRLRTSSWKISPDFFAIQKKDAHIISHRDWKRTLWVSCFAGVEKSFILYTSGHHFSTDNRIESKWSLFFIFLVVHVTCDLGW